LSFGEIPRVVDAVSCSSAASCQAQINSLNSQNANDQQALSQLAAQQQNYQQTLNSLNSQIASIQAALSANQAKQVTLNAEIAADQSEIAQKKATLADDIKTMYVSGQMSTIEELATSQNLSDFIDKQQYRLVIQDQLTYIIKQITSLQKALQSQKIELDNIIAGQQVQDNQLSSAQAQEQQLVSYNQSQQSAYNQQVSTNQSNIAQLQANLSALDYVGTTSITANGVCGGGYPQSAPSSTSPGTYWGCNWPQDNTTDNWNMLNRECVSYTAFIVAEKYGVSTANWGDAYQWVNNAIAAGYSVSSTPQVGDVAIRGQAPGAYNPNSPYYGDVGHAMYVVAVNGPNSITVDEYNEFYNGTFDQRTFDPSQVYAGRGGMYYINFSK
jgi:surface antigen/peptidoglycan hydrolase CwlO-like protein